MLGDDLVAKGVNCFTCVHAAAANSTHTSFICGVKQRVCSGDPATCIACPYWIGLGVEIWWDDDGGKVQVDGGGPAFYNFEEALAVLTRQSVFFFTSVEDMRCYLKQIGGNPNLQMPHLEGLEGVEVSFDMLKKTPATEERKEAGDE